MFYRVLKLLPGGDNAKVFIGTVGVLGASAKNHHKNPRVQLRAASQAWPLSSSTEASTEIDRT